MRQLYGALLGPVAKILFSLSYLIWLCISLLPILISNRDIKRIYLFEEGGFGHQISQIHLLNQLVDKCPTVVMIFDRNRHSPNIEKLFPNRFHFLCRTKLIAILRVGNAQFRVRRKDQEFYMRFESAIYSLFASTMKLFSFDVIRLRDLLKILSDQGFSELGPRELLRAFYNSEKLKIDNMPELSEQVMKIKQRLLKENYSVPTLNRIYSLYIRRKGALHKEEGLRSFGDVNKIVTSLRYLKRSGSLVLIYGDSLTESEERVLIEAGGILPSHLELPRSEWNLIAPIVSDFTLGSPGGGLLIPVLFGKKICVLDGFGFWFGLPNALHSYKVIETSLGERVSSKPYFEETPMEVSFPNLVIRSMNEEELLSTVMEFEQFILNELKDSKIKLNFAPNCWLSFSPNAKISPKYLSLNIFN